MFPMSRIRTASNAAIRYFNKNNTIILSSSSTLRSLQYRGLPIPKNNIGSNSFCLQQYRYHGSDSNKNTTAHGDYVADVNPAVEKAHLDSEGNEIPMPCNAELRNYAIHCMVPMIGFGFMDNLVMIQVGELIDSSIGVTFGFATMTSAAFGQVCSDVSGVCFGGVVDAAFAKLGLPSYFLTSDQISLQRVRIVRTSAMVIGVAVGCLLGMSCLLFMDLDKAERLKKQKELKTIFTVLATKGSEMMNCERVILHILDKDDNDGQTYIWTMAKQWSEADLDKKKNLLKKDDSKRNVEVTPEQLATALRMLKFSEGEIKDLLPTEKLTRKEADKFLNNLTAAEEQRIPLREGGTKWQCVTDKRILNVGNVASDTRFVRSHTLKMMPQALRPESTLLGPVLNDDGEVIGIVEMINKFGDDGSVIDFSKEDERLMQMLAHHCTLFLQALGDD